MFMFFSLISLSWVGIYLLFSKKLLSLLMIELSFVILIFIFFFFSYNSLMESSFFSIILFLGFMVLDSVLGLCCLIVCSRNSSSFLSLFFC